MMERESGFQKKKKRSVWLFLLLTTGIGLLSSGRIQAQDAAEILDRMAGLYEKSGGMSARFQVQASDGKEPVSGQLDMRGDKFRLISSENHIFFDGTTQWVYLPGTDEVNVSKPEPKDLMLNNISFLLKHYKEEFTARCLPADGNGGKQAVYRVELTPRREGYISRVVLSIGKKAYLPAALQIELSDGQEVVVTVSGIKTGVNQPESFFVFKEADYPNAEIIDLR